MPFKDPEKRREFRRDWYNKNKNSEKLHVKRRKIELRHWFEEYKKELSCSKCSEKHVAIIDFHHKVNQNKDNNISFMVANGYSKDKIEKEISKCQILCSNCHRKLHYKNRNI